MDSGGSGTLSTKPIASRRRLIFALDADIREARGLVGTLGDSVRFYKLGLELLMSGDYLALTTELLDAGNEVMLDFKFFDVPATIAAAVGRAADSGATFATVHGNGPMLEAAVRAGGGMGILAVTALTSLDQTDLDDLGFQVSIERLVLSRARRALEAGCAGVISSGLEVPRLRAGLGDGFVIVVPGIRPVQNRDDHKRVVSVEEAFLRGADHVVVGRPIRLAPDPRAKAEEIQSAIAEVFSQRRERP